jgi:hypothetical protein
MDPTTTTALLALGALFALTWLLKKLRESQETLSLWTIKSDAFAKWTKDQDAKIVKEAEATRNLVRDVRDEMLREIGTLRETHATHAEVERWKGRTRTLEALQHAHHGVSIPSDSSSFSRGDHT